MFSDDIIEIYILMCKAVSKPIRLKLISTIGQGEMNVSELAQRLQTPMSNLSNHLGDLYRIGVLSRRKQGTSVYYRLVDPDMLAAIERMRDSFTCIIGKRGSSWKK